AVARTASYAPTRRCRRARVPPRQLRERLRIDEGDMVSITGRTALVTGGGSGIGFASAARLARDGAHVTICGRTEEKLTKAVAAIEPEVGDGGSIRSIVADVTIEDQVAAAVSFAREPGPGLDILFANAGGSLHIGPFESAPLEG